MATGLQAERLRGDTFLKGVTSVNTIFNSVTARTRLTFNLLVDVNGDRAPSTRSRGEIGNFSLVIRVSGEKFYSSNIKLNMFSISKTT